MGFNVRRLKKSVSKFRIKKKYNKLICIDHKCIPDPSFRRFIRDTLAIVAFAKLSVIFLISSCCVSSHCKKRQFFPKMSAREYPVILSKALFTYISGNPGLSFLADANVIECSWSSVYAKNSRSHAMHFFCMHSDLRASDSTARRKILIYSI